MSQTKAEFWIKNISKRNVTLGDLAISVKAGSSVNLLSKGFAFTLEQLQKSAESGSLHAKSSMIKIRIVPPQEIIRPGIYCFVPFEPAKTSRSQIKIIEKKYDELDLSDEKYAAAAVADDNDTE